MEEKIRNFCIIAHIDHGKSTLADRFLEITKTVSNREMRAQVLDQMDLEREKGITIKLQPVSMIWKDQQLNMIDTPGHVDFGYEVSRSLAAVEGAILLVDATQGIQAQTLSNLYLAIEQNLTIIPVLNKIDLPAADIAMAKNEIVHLLGCKEEEILCVSAKTGENVEVLLDKIVELVPSPKRTTDEAKALIFDSQFDEYKGIITYVRVFSGEFKKGEFVHFVSSKSEAQILECGIFKPSMLKTDELKAGSIGYLITNVRDITATKVGDTIVAKGSSATSLPGYKDVRPMVFAGIYPEEGSEFNKLRDAIQKLKLNDSSLTFEPESSPVLGLGFRCGFLGLLHLEIFQERLIREFNVSTIVTTPSVAYEVDLTSGESIIVTSPATLPDPSKIAQIREPMVNIELITPKKSMGLIMDYLATFKADLKNTSFIDDQRLILSYHLALSAILTDFYDKIKNLSSGYGSYSYELAEYQPCDVVKLEILVAEELVPSLTTLVYRDEAFEVGKRIVKTLKDEIPRKQFVIKLQAAVGGKIVAGERITALRKDVTAKLYGGDVTRKRKLLEKQKKGKKKMMSGGKVEIPQKAFLAVLKR